MKEINICADPFPPYQYVDENNIIQGTDYHIVVSALTSAGYEPVVHINTWNEIYEKFENGEYDAIFQVQNSREREEKYYLSKLIRYAETVIITGEKRLTQVKSYKELEMYKVGVISGFTNGEDVDSLKEECKTGFENTEKLLEGIKNGQVQFGVCDKGVMEYYKDAEDEFYIIDIMTYARPLFVMFHDSKVRDDFNEALDGINV